MQRDVNILTIQELLGHELITSTQIYLHTTVKDLREMASNHPMKDLSITVASLIEGVRLPIDHPPRCRRAAPVAVLLRKLWEYLTKEAKTGKMRKTDGMRRFSEFDI